MDQVFAVCMRGGLTLPAPSKTRKGEHVVSPSAETMAKAALYVAMKDAKSTKVQLAKRLGINEKEFVVCLTRTTDRNHPASPKRSTPCY